MPLGRCLHLPRLIYHVTPPPRTPPRTPHSAVHAAPYCCPSTMAGAPLLRGERRASARQRMRRHLCLRSQVWWRRMSTSRRSRTSSASRTRSERAVQPPASFTPLSVDCSGVHTTECWLFGMLIATEYTGRWKRQGGESRGCDENVWTVRVVWNPIPHRSAQYRRESTCRESTVERHSRGRGRHVVLS